MLTQQIAVTYLHYYVIRNKLSVQNISSILGTWSTVVVTNPKSSTVQQAFRQNKTFGGGGGVKGPTIVAFRKYDWNIFQIPVC